MSKVTGQHLKNFVALESQDTLKNFLHESFLMHGKGAQKIECELVLAGKVGIRRYVSVEALSAEGGSECCTTIIDITVQKKLEDTLKRERQMNKALLRLIQDGVCIFDRDGDVLQVNDTFCHMLGYTQDELLPMNIAQWNTQWSADELKGRIENVKSSDPKFETRYRCKDGSIIDVEVNESSVVIDGQRMILSAARNI